ncbi:MAG: hypothetical protein ABS92_05845 [Thiobacillus sp. SCN 63-374]|nr:MAG: hypothetical protein ABS92_05845 [Thiobacillus sp. SCN 63-374]
MKVKQRVVCGLDDNHTHIQQIVGKAMTGFEREFTDGDTTRSVDVGSGGIADVPACRLQQHINIATRLLFRLWSQDVPCLCCQPDFRIAHEVID